MLLFNWKKWWRRVFWRLHDHANQCICFVQGQLSGYYYASEGFHMELAISLTAHALQLRRHPARPHTTTLSRITGKHYIYRSSNLKRCRVCSYKKSSSKGTKYKDKKIMTWCPKCNIHLCVGKYFEAYHSRVNYRKF